MCKSPPTKFGSASGLGYEKSAVRDSFPCGTSPPRLRDLGHSFACGRCCDGYRAGVDPAQRLLQLSTFLGHVQPESTAVYLTITSDLLAEAGYRFQVFARPLVEQVRR